jgi:pyrroline-5-carboxylate reductase
MKPWEFLADQSLKQSKQRTEMKKTIGIFGIGNMGYPIYKNIPDIYNILVYDPYTRQKGIPLESSSDDVIERSDILILCVKPDKIESVLRNIRFPKKIISIAAGITLSTLKLNSHSESKVIRIMPNLPLVSGEGVIACYGDTDLVDETKSIFQNTGLVIELNNENDIDIITALSGSGPAYVYTFLQALAEGGLKCGLSYAQSLQIAIQTVKGSVIYLENELKNNASTHPYQLRNRVASPSGTTIYGLESLEKNGFSYAVMEAIFEGYLRAKELGRKKD